MIKKALVFLFISCLALSACSVYKGVEGVKANGAVEGGAPSRNIRKDIQKQQKKQKKQYDREMKSRAKRMGTTKKR